MTHRDTGVPTITKIGHDSDQAANYRALAEASRPVNRVESERTPSALETFDAKAETQRREVLYEDLSNRDPNTLDRSQREFLKAHGS